MGKSIPPFLAFVKIGGKKTSVFDTKNDKKMLKNNKNS